jgi:succinate-acetate transporter protein
LSVNDDRLATTTASSSGIADPAPLGLAAFALTTFLLSAVNAHWMTPSNSSTGAFIGYAFAYGGLCQLLAGMWEFKNRNVFGATAFSTYGGFWIGLGLWVELVAPHAASAAAANHDVGWILFAFAIFNLYMLVWSTQVNVAVFAVFLTLELTEIFVSLGKFNLQGAATGNGLLQVGGIIGIVTAAAAWYASAAGVTNGLPGRLRLPVGKPLIS